MHYVHKKARCGPEIATFRTKTPCFVWVICLNWLAKIELRGTRTPGLQYCCWLYCCKRKMLKRNWNWRNYRLFCHIFVIGEISIGEGADPLSPSPWLRLCSKRRKQKRCSQIFCEVSGVFQRNFNCSKNTAVLEPRTGQFSRTWGFEAKAKDLTFEAKAKDFKMCPCGRSRGQGRPRGLHLWQQRIQKSSFFHLGHTKKSQIAVIIQASLHNKILICE